MNHFTPVKIIRSFCLALFMVVNLFFLSGCTSLTDKQQTVGEGAITGSVIGGIIGGVTGLLAGGDGKSAAIGAISGVVAGGVAGGIYGNHIANKKQNFANNEAYMKAVIAEADEVVAKSKEERKILQANNTKRQENINILKMQKKSQDKSNVSLARLAEQNTQDIEKTNQLILSIENEIKVQKTVLTKEKVSLSPQLISISETKTSNLEIEHRKLKLLKAQLASLDMRRMY